MSKIPQIGELAPAFNAVTQTESPFSLSDLQEKWVVLYFYPKDNTPGCTAQAQEFTALLPEFQALNAEVVGVSPDSARSHAKFQTKHNLDITLLADGQAIADSYGVWQLKKMMGKEYMGIVRSTFVIDPTGKIAWSEIKVKAKGHAEKLLAELKMIVAAKA
ncbi:MAG: peroxiredoxin [Cyanobacteria bacterium P01_H01_bin.15]